VALVNAQRGLNSVEDRYVYVQHDNVWVQSTNAIDGILSVGDSPYDFKLFLQFEAKFCEECSIIVSK